MSVMLSIFNAVHTRTQHQQFLERLCCMTMTTMPVSPMNHHRWVLRFALPTVFFFIIVVMLLTFMRDSQTKWTPVETLALFCECVANSLLLAFVWKNWLRLLEKTFTLHAFTFLTASLFNMNVHHWVHSVLADSELDGQIDRSIYQWCSLVHGSWHTLIPWPKMLVSFFCLDSRSTLIWTI